MFVTVWVLIIVLLSVVSIVNVIVVGEVCVVVIVELCVVEVVELITVSISQLLVAPLLFSSPPYTAWKPTVLALPNTKLPLLGTVPLVRIETEFF